MGMLVVFVVDGRIHNARLAAHAPPLAETGVGPGTALGLIAAGATLGRVGDRCDLHARDLRTYPDPMDDCCSATIRSCASLPEGKDPQMGSLVIEI